MNDLNFNLKTKNNWLAHWIWDEGDSTSNTWMCFRKTFECEKIPLSLKAHISVDSKYWLWINDKLVTFEGGLNRGAKQGAGYYDVASLDGCLNQGLNTIAVLVWYWGNEGRNSVDSGKGGFLFELENNEQCILSDSLWKVKRHPSYIAADDPHPSFLYAGHNICYDARSDMDNWNSKNFDDSNWEHATEIGVPPCKPWGELFERPIPPIKDYGVHSYANISCDENSLNKILTADLPYAAHVSPAFAINAEIEGLKIDIRTDRYEVNGGPGDNRKYNSHRTEYITKKGVQNFESLDWLFGEKVIYTFPKGIEVILIQYRETGYNASFSGSFECSDGFLNKLYEKCKRTLYICMRDNYMDCPDRERGQWIGDVSLQIPQTFYALERSSDLLTKKAIRDFILWTKDGVLRGNVPGIHCSELPSQSLNAISEFGMIMSYYIHSGDSSVLYESYDAIIKYLSLWEMDKNGLLIPRKGDWYWFDHGEKIDKPVLEYAWYYSALKSAKKIAELIGEQKDNQFFEDRLEKIENNFDKLFWDGTGYRSAEFYDDRSNAMAVLTGLASSDKWSAILEILTNVKQATPYMEAYILEALFVINHGQAAMSRMRERYAELVSNENSTVWEDFFVLGTKNHAWSGGPLTILSKYVAGVSPLTAGYSTFEILPQLFYIEDLKILIPTVKGEIKVHIINKSDQFILNLDSPSNTNAIVGIPKCLLNDKEVKKVYCNDVCIWENGKLIMDLPIIQKCNDSDSFIKFIAWHGTWSFSAI
ncbi:MAG: alpha-L-rhamnosidase N-terminal domain-containing protein [Bacillota bacterium]|nr:alpha-L-rhamnosidase N-terminal domain-containing protein [Bacillota bacterium]